MFNQQRKPNFFIVGAPKCGTTSLYEYLRVHPDVFMPDRKEPLFFCTDFIKPRRMEEREYLELFRPATGQKRVGEGSTWYLYSEKAPAAIKEFSPDARIIIMVRNPVDMAYSLHSQMLWNAVEEIEDFEAALEAEEDRKRGVRLPRLPFPPKLMIYRELARYSSYIENYIETFGRDRILILLFEEFTEEPESEYRRVCDFLEIEGTFRGSFGAHNRNKRLRSVTLRRLTRSRSPLKGMRHVVPGPMRQQLKRSILKVNTKVEKRAPMPTSLRDRLDREFEPEIARMSTILGRDLSLLWGGGSKVLSSSIH